MRVVSCIICGTANKLRVTSISLAHDYTRDARTYTHLLPMDFTAYRTSSCSSKHDKGRRLVFNEALNSRRDLYYRIGGRCASSLSSSKSHELVGRRESTFFIIRKNETMRRTSRREKVKARKRIEEINFNKMFALVREILAHDD